MIQKPLSPVAAALSLCLFGCFSCDDAGAPASPDGLADASPDADAGTPIEPDASIQDAAPSYERPPPTPEVTGHLWRAKDIGPVSELNRAAAMRIQSGVMRVTAGGQSLGGTTDSLAFISQRVKGNADIIARVRSLQMADPTTTAGIMLRADDTDAGAAAVYLGILAEPMRGGQVVVRRSQGAASDVAVADAQIKAQQLLRIRREGRSVTVWRTANPAGWVKLTSVELDLPEEISVGVAVSARSATATTVAEIDFLRLFSSDAAASAQGWNLDFLNAYGAAASLVGGELTVNAAADGFTTVAEQGAPVMAPITGTHTLTARIESLEGGSAARARVALTFREGRPWGLGPLSRHVLVSLDGAGVLRFQRRDGGTNFEPGKSKEGVRPPLWLRLQRLDDPITFRTRVSGLYSLDGATWTELDGADFAFPDPVMAGVLLTSGDSRSHATARFTGVSLVPSAVQTPAPPPDAGTQGADGP